MSPGRVSDAVMEATKTSAAVSLLAAFYQLPNPTHPPSQIIKQTGTQAEPWKDKDRLLPHMMELQSEQRPGARLATRLSLA